MILNRATLLAFAAGAFLFSLTSAKQDEIHIQWAICGPNYQDVLQKLGLGDQGPYKGNNLTYYDTAPPIYDNKGIGFRSKYQQGLPVSLVKVRYDEKPNPPPAGSVCVWDEYGTTVSYTCGVAFHLTSTSPNLWSANQTAFAQQYGPVDWAAFKAYGPYFDPKWKFRIGKLKAKFDVVHAEAHGKPLELMEIEIKTKLSKHKKVHKKVSKWLKKQGITLCGQQHPKTVRLFEALYGTGQDGSPKDQETLEDRNLGEQELK